jgi:exopolysaccharide production protein ExoZ
MAFNSLGPLPRCRWSSRMRSIICSKGNAGEIFQLGARYGVTLFFVISGFIMTQTTGLHRFNPGQFLNRRVRRVVPIYWFATFLVASVTLIAPGMFQRTVFDPQHFFLSLFFIPAYDPSGTGGIWPMFKLGWTLNYEKCSFTFRSRRHSLLGW